MSRERVNRLVAWMGASTIAFGIWPVVAPRSFARLFDLPVQHDPRLLAMVRSVGARDAALGAGLWLAARQGGPYEGWLLSRIASDAGDSLAIALAAAQGSRQPRFLGLGALAIGATVVGWMLQRADRSTRQT